MAIAIFIESLTGSYPLKLSALMWIPLFYQGALVWKIAQSSRYENGWGEDFDV